MAKSAAPQGKADARLSVAEGRKLRAQHTDMATTLAEIASNGSWFGGNHRRLARECLARLNGEGAEG